MRRAIGRIGLASVIIGGGLLGLVADALSTDALAADPEPLLRPVADLDAEALARYAAGGAVFRKLWVSAPSSTTASDGLGPLYNARSCAQCHPRGGRGHPMAEDGSAAPALVLRLSVPPATDAERALLLERRAIALPEPTYGLQLQPFAIQGHAGEGRLAVSYERLTRTLPDGETVELQRPVCAITELGYGPLSPAAMMSPRLAPPVAGMGLLEAVPEAQILAAEDPDDRNGDGIRGRANRVRAAGTGNQVLGRFGWKASIATLSQQVAEALATDIGLSSRLADRPHGDCTPRQIACIAAPTGADRGRGGHEVGEAILDLLVLHMAASAPPPRQATDAAAARDGERLFAKIGCAACHRPRLETAVDPRWPHLRAQVIWPYTDLLLHDMGEDLADHRPEGGAGGRDWRTPPLWGIGLTARMAARQAYLHDGRARSLKEAVLWHGGEARSAREAFEALPRADREAVLRFVQTL